ncbi:MAG: M23 family metallopeptidase [Gaiellaceae bacterium]
MATSLARLVWRPAVAAVLALAAAGALIAHSLLVSADRFDPGTSLVNARFTTARAVHQATPAVDVGSHAYKWPVKPFNRQHPVRGYFGDPRIANHGESRQFHFGVDISAPNETPVHATITGTVYIHPLHPTTVAIVGPNGKEFSYWHVVPTVRNGQRAIAYKTVIGRIEAPYGHVHFSEARDGLYLNPLRPGAMGPYADDTRPRVTSVRAEHAGRIALVAEAYDETPLAVPRPWHDLPVMPVLVRWRLLDTKGRSVLGWRTAADFRMTIPPASTFDEVWAPRTMQNHVRAPGRYRVYLSRSLTGLRAGKYVVEVTARDTGGNAAVERFALEIASALSGS